MLTIVKTMRDTEVQKFAKNMRKLRESKRWYQGDIHRSSKIDRAYISNLEVGKQNPTLETIRNLMINLY